MDDFPLLEDTNFAQTILAGLNKSLYIWETLLG